MLADDCSYIKDIITLLLDAEDLDDEPALSQIFVILRSLILLNNEDVILQLLSDDFFLNMMKGLTHDPEVAPSERIDHVANLSAPGIFKQLIPIRDKDTLEMIHFNFRVQYLLDTVMARVIDDQCHNTLNTIIHIHTGQIVRNLYQDGLYFKELFRKLNDPCNTSESMWGLLVS